MKQQLTKEISEIMKDLGVLDKQPLISASDNPNHGDYTSNIALMIAKDLKRPPMEVGEMIKQKLEEKKLDFIEGIEVAKPGFINLNVNRNALITNLEDLLEKKAGFFEKGNLGTKKETVVEYSSPNIAKPFTVGHLRSTIIGDAIANLLQSQGNIVHRDNHVGDWGTQFGKQIYAIKAWGNEKEIEKSPNPVKLLVQLYVKFHEEVEKNPQLEDEARAWFKKLEDGDPEARRLWKNCIEWSWKEFDRLYRELGVSFNENDGRGYGESFFEDKMQAVVEELKQKGLLKESEGAQLVFFPNEKYPPLMIIKKDGATLYSTRDLATDKFRIDRYGNDVVIINEVGAEQSLYFQQLYMTERMLGWVKDGQRVHIKHGMYRFKDQKMSTRKGNVVWLEDVLEEAKKRAFSLSKEGFNFEENTVLTVSSKKPSAARHIKGFPGSAKIQEMIAIGAIKWNDLKRSPEQDIVFDWDDILNMQGNSGPYMQYSYVRTKSILDNPKISGREYKIKPDIKDLTYEEKILLRKLLHFKEVVQTSAETYSPNTLCTYLFELAQSFNLFYQKVPILKDVNSDGELDDLVQFRLKLTESVGIVIHDGLELLGIQTPEKM